MFADHEGIMWLLTAHSHVVRGEHPISELPLPSLPCEMKHNKHSQQQTSKSASAAEASAGLNPNAIDFAPAPDEVAKRAYFSYESQGSVPGNQVQHWLAAESELIAEHKASPAAQL